MEETLPARRGVGTAVKQASRGAGARTAPRHQAELPETAPAGRGVSRTTGTQKAGWARMRGRTGMVVGLLGAAALAGAAQTVGVDGGRGGVLHE